MGESKKIEFTPSQKNAVDAEICDILVSAAAGSGKTAVLTGRLVKQLCGEDVDGVATADITDMLIVTYTKAAASQLRSKISRALRDEIAKHPESKRLRAQLRRLDRARISTIHSFCFDIVKENFSLLGLPASVRIAETAENSIVMRQCMNELIEEHCEKSEAFAELIDNVTVLRDAGVAEIMCNIYKDMQNLCDGIEFIKKSADKVKCAVSVDAAKSDFFATVAASVTEQMRIFRYNLKDLLDRSLDDAGLYANIKEPFEQMIRYSEEWEEARESGIEAVMDFVSSYKVSGIGKKKTEDEELKQKCSYIKSEFKKFVDSLKKLLDVGDYENDCRAVANYLDALYDLLSDFDLTFKKEKTRLGIMDFSDLERYTLSLLVDENGNPTEIAENVKSRISQIYIDEYQDVNEVQDKIFSAISKNNRFMVGDIKQSIYGFRGAEPALFAHYREEFSDYGKEADDEEIKGKRIFLSENFRSDAPVINFANMVFASLFRNNGSDVPYLKEDELVHAKPMDEDCVVPEIVLVEKNEENAEVNYICDQIESLVNDKGVPPNEIAVLARGNSFLDEVAKELSKRDISFEGRANESVFDSPDVLLMMCILNCIDNPRREIYLAGALKSPVFGITLSELTLIKTEYPKDSLYTALCKYTEKHDYKKGKEFIRVLDKYREYAECMSSEKIIHYIMTTTPIRASAANAGINTEALTRLYDIARRYEADSFKGLHSFIKYVNSLMEKESTDDGEGITGVKKVSSVKLMSIHKSKGLEFKYVFLGECAKKLDDSSRVPDILYDKALGMATKIRDSETFIKHDPFIRRAIMHAHSERSLCEEMRILYVALTRSTSSLVVTASDKNIFDKPDSCSLEAEFISPRLFRTHMTFIQWILYSLSGGGKYRIVKAFSSEKNEKSENGDDENQKPSPVMKKDMRDTLISRLTFEYPHSESVSLPTKLSVSRLFPGVLDDDDGEVLRAERSEFMDKPKFLEGKVSHTGADRGTATHLFMQFCSFKDTAEKGVDEEIERLVNDKYITREIAELIYRDKVTEFFKGELFARICKSVETFREKRFNVRLPADQLTKISEKKDTLSGETVLVQGVVDCLITNPNGTLTLIDYKTDHLPCDSNKAIAILKERYTNQLSYYKAAVEKLTGKEVEKTLIYSFSLGKAIEI